MIFWRIKDNIVYNVADVKTLGFETDVISDEYLENEIFTVMRTCHGIGDWGIISAMPRLLKQKYPNCKVYLPSEKLLTNLFSTSSNMCESWNNPFRNVYNIFKNNPYVDAFKDYIIGDIFHDHYRVYDKNNLNIPLMEQMLKFWQFTPEEYSDSQPEIYWSNEEKKFGDNIIDEYTNGEFGCLLISDRYKTEKDKDKIVKLLNDNPVKYFYYIPGYIEDSDFNFIDRALDFRNIEPRIQLYIKSKARINIGNQCGMNHLVVRYSNVIEVQRQFPLKHNFIKGETYL